MVNPPTFLGRARCSESRFRNDLAARGVSAGGCVSEARTAFVTSVAMECGVVGLCQPRLWHYSRVQDGTSTGSSPLCRVFHTAMSDEAPRSPFGNAQFREYGSPRFAGFVAFDFPVRISTKSDR
jgi:hypothetical protein